ncbi:MAG TPA: ABC transporter permease [Actinomycetota bacterium]|jgi:peptide/nickel transport system permease protein|nr:ABC transporter permease [Actinomycetota bacterium]
MAKQTSSLRRYLITRVLLAVPMLLILLTVVFLLMRVAPGDPISAALGGRVSQAELDRRRHEAGFDRPVVVQYVDYLGDVARFDFGNTLVDNRPLTQVIVQNGAATLELSLFAMVIAAVSGVLIGLLAGRFRDTPIDVAGRLFGIVMYGAPVFFLGFLAQLVFGKWLGWLPASGRASPVVTFELRTHTNLFVVDAIINGDWSSLVDVLKHLVMPAIVLGLVIGGVFIRLVRVNLLQTLKGDYVEAARARGIRERAVVWRHAFKNALVPVVTVMGLQFAVLLSGAVLTEQTFNWPGLGSELVRYLNNRDYVAVQGIITFTGIVVVVVSLLIDVISAWVDPRVRY